MTETTAVGTVCTLEHLKFGTVGRPLPGVEIRIADEDGEILVRGPHVFREYWRNPGATAERWSTGGCTPVTSAVDDEGYLSITGRKKDIIITAGGKNLTPSNIENDLKQSRYISQAVMHGDRRPFPVALITLDPEEILPWAKEQGLPEEMGTGSTPTRSAAWSRTSSTAPTRTTPRSSRSRSSRSSTGTLPWRMGS